MRFVIQLDRATSKQPEMTRVNNAEETTFLMAPVMDHN